MKSNVRKYLDILPFPDAWMEFDIHFIPLCKKDIDYNVIEQYKKNWIDNKFILIIVRNLTSDRYFICQDDIFTSDETSEEIKKSELFLREQYDLVQGDIKQLNICISQYVKCNNGLILNMDRQYLETDDIRTIMDDILKQGDC